MVYYKVGKALSHAINSCNFTFSGENIVLNQSSILFTSSVHCTLYKFSQQVNVGFLLS
jgi:hypothetical protein